MDPDRVVKAVATRLYRHARRNEFNTSLLVFAGSYPASIRAPRERGFPLHYNDIDVYVATTAEEEGEISWHGDGNEYSELDPNILDGWYEQNVVPGSDIKVNVIVMRNMSLRRLIHSFDTNCVRVGFSIRGYDPIRDRSPPRPIWYETPPEFGTFLTTRVLSIHDITALKYPAAAFIRLLYKAQQLRLDFALPDEEALLSAVGGRCFGRGNIGKFNNLSRLRKQEVTRRFEYEEITSSYGQLIKLHRRSAENARDGTRADILGILPRMELLAIHY